MLDAGARKKRDLPIALSCFSIGGAERDRTDDLLRAKQALSQLSYSPTCDADNDAGNWLVAANIPATAERGL